MRRAFTIKDLPAKARAAKRRSGKQTSSRSAKKPKSGHDPDEPRARLRRWRNAEKPVEIVG